jgi:superfamily I DNA and/or RNA helicase
LKGRDGIITRRILEASDVAVVAAYNTQVSFIRSRLDDAGLNEIEVGTADRLQGGQWAAVVAVDPTAGAASMAGHNVSPGRLCVMLSRHTSYLCWVGEDTATWRARISAGDLPARDRGIALQMRLKLDKTPRM